MAVALVPGRLHPPRPAASMVTEAEAIRWRDTLNMDLRAAEFFADDGVTWLGSGCDDSRCPNGPTLPHRTQPGCPALDGPVCRATTDSRDEPGGQAPAIKPDHRPRPDPYPDELAQLLCDVCETLCSPGRPCHCCWVDQLAGQDGD